MELAMNTVNYNKPVENDIDIKDKAEKDVTNQKSKIVDLITVQNTIQAMLIQKVFECQDLVTDKYQISNPFIKLCITYGIFNARQCLSMFKFGMKTSFSTFKQSYFTAHSMIFKRTIPTKKTFEIKYFTDNQINHLYLAFDWYLKTHTKRKVVENHMLLMMNKPVDATKVEKEFNVQQAVPNDKETEFDYETFTFNYSKSEFNDVLYGPGGEIKKKNYKLLLWTYDCTDEVITELSNYVLNMYAKSKIDEVWTQKIFNHRNGAWTETSVDRNKRRINTVILHNNEQKNIAKSLTYFNDNEKWYSDRGIPYKKSYLFYGPPGTGKTSMIKAISYELQKHIYFVNLSMIKDDAELATLLGKLEFKDLVLVIEDIDAQGDIAHDRQLIQKEKEAEKLKEVEKPKDEIVGITSVKAPEKSKLTLSGLLNQIDGVQNNHGMMLVMTTNRPKILDKALTRDGRVDDKIFFNYATHQQIYDMMTNFYNDDNITLSLVKSMIDTTVRIIPAVIENAMVKHYESYQDALKVISEYQGADNDFEEFEF
jgi:hypothetical protein